MEKLGSKGMTNTGVRKLVNDLSEHKGFQYLEIARAESG